MAVIKKLGDRVEHEHDRFLRDSQRLEDRSAIPVSDTATNPLGGDVNFENLVGRGDGVTVKPDTVVNGSSKGWDEDDVWGSIFSSDDTVSVAFPPRFRPCVLIPSSSPRTPRPPYPLNQLLKRHLYLQPPWVLLSRQHGPRCRIGMC